MIKKGLVSLQSKDKHNLDKICIWEIQGGRICRRRKMIKVGICDDNEILLAKYQEMIMDIRIEQDVEVSVSLFRDGIEVIRAFEKEKNSFDILYMDILMPNLNGIETVRKLRLMHSHVIIVILTSSEEYIFDSMEIQVMDYLMKDQVTKASFEASFLKCLGMNQTKKDNVFRFEKDGLFTCIPYQDIIYIQAQGTQYAFHSIQGETWIQRDDSFIEVMEKAGFAQTHSLFYVGLRYIKQIEKTQVRIIGDTQDSVPLNKCYEVNLKNALAKFMMKNL